ncbi:MAG: hypothetical protein GQ583_06280 [Methyloprofundus sp.]|nr:hypothetical protein [Methyloprofundus sp.]
MNTFKKLSISSLLLAGLTLSPLAMAMGPFEGRDVNVKFEMWEVDADKNITDVLIVRNELDVTASNETTPDAEDFHAMDENFHLWDIDFNKRSIELTFTSIEAQTNEEQYMYMQPVGFRFSDEADNLSDILYVDVDDQYAPSAYNKDLVRYDANNITVNLQGSMCHVAGMAGMPQCDNEASPTEYNNIIKLDILFADNADALYGWAESKYSELFPASGESFSILGYYAREYPNYYLGIKDGDVYLYDKNSGDLVNLGSVNPFLELMHEDMHSADNGCAEGQHMMPDGTCMNNNMM